MLQGEALYQHQQQTDLIGKITFHQQINVSNKSRNIQTPQIKKVFILHTGGTIGMFRNFQGKFSPVKDQFKKFLTDYPYFCDQDQTYFKSKEGFIITPPSIQGQNICYKFTELQNLIDSTNMNFKLYNFILDEIQKVYNQYDAFVILHGTDTMSYTASALSFMIENLQKPIVFTGAKIPIGETRNDACSNLLSALTIAGHYSIPQVLIVFDNKVLRGNRTNKYSTSSFQFFKTPNFYPLGQLGLTISIKWQKILPCNYQLPTKFVYLTQEVQIIKLAPYGFITLPQSKYIVVQSFGDGNIPTQGPFYQWALANSKLPQSQRKMIVNVSQVYQSVIKNIYETGQMASKLGLISGSDMTVEAGIAKLSYLVSKGYTKFQDLNEMMQRNLRGQLTQEEDRFMKQKQNYTVNSMILLDRHLQKRTNCQKQILVNSILEGITIDKPSKSALNRLLQFNFDVKKIYPDNSNILIHLMQEQHRYSQLEQSCALDQLLSLGVDCNLIDEEGNSAVFYAIVNRHYESANKIIKQGGIMKTSFQRILRAVKQKDIDLLYSLMKFGEKFQDTDQEGRGFLFYALLWNNQSALQFFKNFSNLYDQSNLASKDIYGVQLKYYVEIFQANNKECQKNG